MTTKITVAALLAGSLLLLAGCGGGGGGSDSVTTTPATTASPTTTTTTTTTIAPMMVENLQTATTPNYAANSQQLFAYNALNVFRAQVGVGPVSQNPNLDTAAANHWNYLALNSVFQHTEESGKQGFTGLTPSDQMTAAGYITTDKTSSQVLGTTNTITNADYVIDVFKATIYHRWGIMREGFKHVGIFVTSDALKVTTIDLGYQASAQNNAGNFVGVYPADNQTGLWLSHYPESPNPFSDVLDNEFQTKTSYPISVMSAFGTRLNVTLFTVTEDRQTTPLDVRLITRDSSAQNIGYLGPNVAFIVGKAAFKPHTKYNVSFTGTATDLLTANDIDFSPLPVTGTANGLAIQKNWSFTTGVDYQ